MVFHVENACHAASGNRGALPTAGICIAGRRDRLDLCSIILRYCRNVSGAVAEVVRATGRSSPYRVRVHPVAGVVIRDCIATDDPISDICIVAAGWVGCPASMLTKLSAAIAVVYFGPPLHRVRGAPLAPGADKLVREKIRERIASHLASLGGWWS